MSGRLRVWAFEPHAPLRRPLDSCGSDSYDYPVAASDIKRSDVLQVIELHEDPDQAAFVDSLGFGPARKYRLVHEGRFYDSKAIAGIAHGVATGQYWTKDDLSGGVTRTCLGPRTGAQQRCRDHAGYSGHAGLSSGIDGRLTVGYFRNCLKAKVNQARFGGCGAAQTGVQNHLPERENLRRHGSNGNTVVFR